MRTLVLLGLAAGSLLLAGHARAEQPSLDYGNPDNPDVRVYTGYPDRVPSEVEYRRVSGYDAERRWTGTWDGTYETTDGRRYEGRYEGTVEGHGAGYPPPSGLAGRRRVARAARHARLFRYGDGIS